MDNNLGWTAEDWKKHMSTDKATVYLQKKVIVRILRDILVRCNNPVNSRDEQVLYWLAFQILRINQDDLDSVLDLNPFTFPIVIGEMDKIRQCSFRRILKEMFTKNGRKPSSKEVSVVESLLDAYPNPYGLESKFEKIPPLYPDYEWDMDYEYRKTQPYYITCW